MHWYFSYFVTVIQTVVILTNKNVKINKKIIHGYNNSPDKKGNILFGWIKISPIN